MDVGLDNSGRGGAGSSLDLLFPMDQKLPVFIYFILCNIKCKVMQGPMYQLQEQDRRGV